jgi:hypothetical protein
VIGVYSPARYHYDDMMMGSLFDCDNEGSDDMLCQDQDCDGRWLWEREVTE